MLEKICDNFLKIIIALLIGVIFWILQNAILNYDIVVYKFNPIFLLIGMAMYLGLLVFVYKKIIPILVKFKYIHFIVFGLFLFISIFAGLKLRVNPTWDMGDIFKIAKGFVLGEETSFAYLAAYPNNIMITIIYAIVFKIALLFNITDFISVATVFNAVIISATVVLTYYIARMIYNKEKALLIAIVMLLTTPLYMHVAIYYTDSMSMFLSTFILFLLLVKNKVNKSFRIMLCILCGFVIIVSWKVKVTGVFVALAYGIYSFIFAVKEKDYKRYFMNAGIIIITLFVCLMGFNRIIESRVLDKNDVNNPHRMPIEHWIILSLTGNGGFDQQVYEYTGAFPTYKEKKEADRKKIKQIIKDYTPNDFVKHLTVKLKYAWTDGTYFAPEKLSRQPVEKGLLHQFVLGLGKYNKYYKYFPQVMHLSLFVLIIYSCIEIIKKKKYSDKKIVLIISMLGLIVFLLIWENRSRYVLTMLPIYILLGIGGIDYFSRRRKEKLN